MSYFGVCVCLEVLVVWACSFVTESLLDVPILAVWYGRFFWKSLLFTNDAFITFMIWYSSVNYIICLHFVSFSYLSFRHVLFFDKLHFTNVILSMTNLKLCGCVTFLCFSFFDPLLIFLHVQSQNISMKILWGQLSGLNRVLILTCKEPLPLMEHLPFCMAVIQSIILRNLRYLKRCKFLIYPLLAIIPCFLFLAFCRVSFNITCYYNTILLHKLN